MQVSMKVSGGYGGLRPPARVVDEVALAPPERDELAALVGRAEAEAVVAPSGRNRVPDARSFVIEVEDGGERRMLHGAEGAMSPGLAALVAWLDRHGK